MAAKKNICPWCGIANPEDAEQCIGCGSDLNAAPASSVESPRPAAAEPAPKSEEEKAKPAAPSPKRPAAQKSAAASPKKKGGSGEIRPGYVYAAIAAIAIVGYLLLKDDQPAMPDVPQHTSLAQTDSTGERIRSMEEYLRSHPGDNEAKLAYANTLHDARQFPKAIAAYQDYLKAVPKNADARVDMAICQFESGDAKAAITELKKALEYEPKHQPAMFNLGVVYLNQQNMKESNDWFSRCAAVDPATPLAARAKQLLTQHSSTNKNP
ncbi:MAG: tetratricopeptide repeat protein [Acidobacteriota bacterium]